MKLSLVCVGVFLVFFARPGAAAPSPAFVSGDRWAVLGDSITQTGAYHQEIELFYLTRRPELNLEVVNCGIAGDTAEGALRRLDWDLFPARPSVVSVMFGMNDVGRHLYAPGKTGPEIETVREQRGADYERAMRSLIGRVLASGARLILVQPTPFDDTAQMEKPNLPGCGGALAAFAVKVRALASELGVATVDFSGPMTALNRDGQARDPRFTIVGPDRVHPGRPGHLVMAFLFLRAQGAPGLVSSIAIDAAAGRASAVENAAVSDLVASPGSVSFSATEAALPFPVEAASAPALALVPFTAELNRQILRVTGLAPGVYRLLIDERSVGEFSYEALSAGVNLAETADTPQMRQARAVRAALGRKWEAAGKLRTIAYSEHFAWPDAPRPYDSAAMTRRIEARIGQVGSSNPWITTQHKLFLDLKPREPELSAEIASALTDARALARPQAHRFRLLPAAEGNTAP